MSIDPNNLAATARLTFNDDFNGLSLWNGAGGTWATTFGYADPKGNGETLASNGEQQWYINDLYGPTGAVDPWAASNGVLTITAAPADGWLQSQINGYAYSSGELNTFHSFSQQYGYFEISAQLPAGKGLWPAFWLVPQNLSWPPEIDVFEVLGDKPNELHTTVHTSQSGAHTYDGFTSMVADTSQGFHTYGVDWEPDRITFYFDRQAVYSVATPADLHQPAYMIVNLAVGGYWPGSPDASTVFPAQLKVDYIRAYAAGADGGGRPPAAAPSAPESQPQPQRIMYGGGDDVIYGSGAVDVIGGGDGADRIEGGAAHDDLNGNRGNDTVSGGGEDDWLNGGQDDDVVSGDGGDDVMNGNMGRDVVRGGAGADIVRGGQGEDQLFGDDGADWLSGDLGSDTLSGGAGADVFHTYAASGRDVVLDFSALDGDRVQIDHGQGFAVAQSGADTVVYVGDSQLVLTNVACWTLPEGWVFQA